MSRKSCAHWVLVPALLAGFFCLGPARADDLAGSQDHPMLSRFPDTRIVAYDQRHHDLAFLPAAPASREGLTAGEWVAGRLTWIVYEGPAGRSTLEIYRNYEKALQEAGFGIRFSCKKEECGYRFIDKMLDATGRMVGSGERWIPDTARYLAAQLARDGGDTWVSLMVYERDGEGITAIRLEIIEVNQPRGLATLAAKQVGQKSVNYDEVRVAGGGVVNRELEAVLELEGAIEWEARSFDRSVSAYEAHASYERHLLDQGYQVKFQCHFAACGFSFIRKVIDLNGNVIAGGESWSEDSGHYLMAKLVSPQKLAYAGVLAYQQPDGTAVSRFLSVTPREIEFNLITVTSESMAEEIARAGKVAVYGIYFDTDSAAIKQESGDTILEIARLMELRPELSLFVDGHTDSEGSDEHNQDLSARRAASVVAALTEKHGVDVGRLEARGLGEAQPVASNDSEEGRAWNRRVELVSR
jgi:outer membrane protein OmpA-like peptidoglycan-associated protein